jgi:nucleoside-diphosphate-sugar epimerase
MRLLMFGGTRFIGRAVVEGAVELGHTVAVYHRGETEPEGMSDILHIHGDNVDIADHLDAIKTFDPDAVIDTTQFDAPRTQTVVDALSGVVDRYVLVSSMDVYIAYGRLHRTEPGPYQSLPLTEESELRKLPGLGNTEELDNLHIERVGLEQDQLPVTIARLPAVFGPGDYQRRVGGMIDKIQKSDGLLKIYPTLADFRWTWGYVFNIADMLIECALDRRPGNRIYNLGFEQTLSNIDMHRLVAASLRWDGEIIATEDGTDVPKLDVGQHWFSDSSKFRRDFGYAERISIEDAFKRTVEGVLRSGNSETD